MDSMKQSLTDELKARREKLLRRNRRYARWQRNWAQIAVTALFIYVALPILAPTLMAAGATGAGNILYTIYSPMCHQFAFRSFFLYGEQSVYPREVVPGQGDIEPFDEAAAQSEEFVRIYEGYKGSPMENPEELSEWSSALQLAARRFRGDERMGYKTALCERDMAIYAAMVVGGIAFLFVRKKLRPVPLLLYVILGLGPIGLDGFSQLFGYPPFEFWAVRETLPEFRVLTGALFGLMNVWLAFPYLEKSFIESAREMEMTFAEIEKQTADL